MVTINDIIKTSAKFDDILSKRPRHRDPTETTNAYQSLSVLKRLSKGKFPTYLTASKLSNEIYVMKMFAYSGDCPQIYYQNEIRFASLKHPNIINCVYYEHEKGIIRKGELKKVSYILMEYAPYGDFFDLVSNYKAEFNEKLVRTYFRQLINGIEFLHRHDIAHLDLKPENLLLGADFNMKITDFDLSYRKDDAIILSRGTRSYRAPEFFLSDSNAISGSKLEDLFAADIYSAGVILFILKSGMYPHVEHELLGGVSFLDLMFNNNAQFWVHHCEAQGKNQLYFSREFRELFNGMTRLNPRERLTIKQIKQSKWYNGPVYSDLELCGKMEALIHC